MNSCGYCGRENDAAAVHCRECGTSFAVETPELTAKPARPTNPKLLSALQAGASVVLILTAVIFAVTAFTFDLEETKHGGKIAKPGSYAVGMLAVFYTVAILFFVVPLVGVACVRKCKSFLIGAPTMILALVMTVLVIMLPLRFFLPAFLFGRVADSAAGYYLGALIQCGFGAWLLGWFNPWFKSKRANVGSSDI